MFARPLLNFKQIENLPLRAATAIRNRNRNSKIRVRWVKIVQLYQPMMLPLLSMASFPPVPKTMVPGVLVSKSSILVNDDSTSLAYGTKSG
jgi:hypothetical protein